MKERSQHFSNISLLEVFFISFYFCKIFYWFTIFFPAPVNPAMTFLNWICLTLVLHLHLLVATLTTFLLHWCLHKRMVLHTPPIVAQLQHYQVPVSMIFTQFNKVILVSIVLIFFFFVKSSIYVQSVEAKLGIF